MSSSVGAANQTNMSPTPGVIAAAIESLGRTGDPRPLPLILDAFRHDQRPFVWQAAREVLREMNHPEAGSRTAHCDEAPP